MDVTEKAVQNILKRRKGKCDICGGPLKKKQKDYCSLCNAKGWR